MVIFFCYYYYFVALFGILYSRLCDYYYLKFDSGGHWIVFLPRFYLGFSGMPRRIHDYPIVFMGWHSMSTAGHFITLIGIIFFFFILFDSHIENKIFTPTTLGIPRWNKRIVYYIFKIRYLQLFQQKLLGLPNFEIREIIQKNYFNEYELYKIK